MAQNRVRIVDVADSLGLSTATVSKVIHGKTKRFRMRQENVSSRNLNGQDISRIWRDSACEK